MPIRGWETWIVREGYEGLVRGNTDPPTTSTLDDPVADPSARQRVRGGKATNFIANLRFGDGDLLRDGTGDHCSGQTLKGRYIVRAGWDDVRGWAAEVCTLVGGQAQHFSTRVTGRNAHRNSALQDIPHARGTPCCCTQPHQRRHRCARRLRW